MSKIGKKLIPIPEGVEVSIAAGTVKVKGPKGELGLALPPKVNVEVCDKEVKVAVSKPEDRKQRALWGTYRSLLNNAILGVTAGFEKGLEIIGVGYKAAVTENKLVLNLGFSHSIVLSIPKGLTVKVEKNTLLISGIDKQEVGEFAAQVRSKRPPEPYKGKGVKYQDEVIRRKAGKVVKAVGA